MNELNVGILENVHVNVINYSESQFNPKLKCTMILSTLADEVVDLSPVTDEDSLSDAPIPSTSTGSGTYLYHNTIFYKNDPID